MWGCGGGGSIPIQGYSKRCGSSGNQTIGIICEYLSVYFKQKYIVIVVHLTVYINTHTHPPSTPCFLIHQVLKFIFTPFTHWYRTQYLWSIRRNLHLFQLYLFVFYSCPIASHVFLGIYPNSLLNHQHRCSLFPFLHFILGSGQG